MRRAMDPNVDVQSLRAPYQFRLTRVGITGVKKPVRIQRAGRKEPTQLTASIEAFVDLPAEQRGIHMSRNIEAINETIDDFARAPASGLEDLAMKVADDLLRRHAYATEVEVNLASDYFLERRNPSGARSLERYELLATARAYRDGRRRKSIGVAAEGMNACPCAMEETRKIYYRAKEAGLQPRGPDPEGPFLTHNQRNRSSLIVTTDAETSVEADDLIDLVESSFSSPTYEILKRGDEARVVLRAHENPKFVEDIVREVLDRFVAKYSHLPPDTEVVARSESFESIHKHDALAERAARLSDLRAA
ncbi:MAG: GTP cyclohydrolase MptA [Methanobacteriota archaeon]